MTPAEIQQIDSCLWKMADSEGALTREESGFIHHLCGEACFYPDGELSDAERIRLNQIAGKLGV